MAEQGYHNLDATAAGLRIPSRLDACESDVLNPTCAQVVKIASACRLDAGHQGVILPTALFHRCFPHEPHHWERYLDCVERQLPKEGRVLDLGCGANTALAPFRSSTREVWGADLHEHPRMQHTRWFRQLSSSGAIPFENSSIDVIAASWVLEHLTEPPAFLREIERVLKPGGVLIAHTINARHYVALLRRLLGVLPHRFNQWLVKVLYGRPEFDTYPAYYRLNTPHSLLRHCASSGLVLEDFRTYADPFYFQFSKPLLNAAVALDWLLEKMLPGSGRIYLTAIIRKPAAGKFPSAGGLALYPPSPPYLDTFRSPMLQRYPR